MYVNINSKEFTISVPSVYSANNSEILKSERLLNQLKEFKQYIFDINFTCRIPPFVTDAMGVNLNEMESKIHLEHVLYLQDKTGITVSPVFNNIYTPNTLENLELFIENFSPLYERGIRSVTIPHVLWMKFGLLQKNFPDLFIKNTVLRRVRTGQEFWNHAASGFDYVNIDRILLRDINALREIKSAQTKFFESTGKYVKTAILTFEGCLGNCPLWEEHYQHTMTHPRINSIENEKIFEIPKSLSCYKVGPNQYTELNIVGLGAFKEDIEELCSYFDIIKIGGRRAFSIVYDELQFISDMTNDDIHIIALSSHKAIINLFRKKNKAVQAWRKAIKSCRYQCWNCNICSNVVGELFSDIAVQ
jgi:hypothetical protein